MPKTLGQLKDRVKQVIKPVDPTAAEYILRDLNNLNEHAAGVMEAAIGVLKKAQSDFYFEATLNALNTLIEETRSESDYPPLQKTKQETLPPIVVMDKWLKGIIGSLNNANQARGSDAIDFSDNIDKLNKFLDEEVMMGVSDYNAELKDLLDKDNNWNKFGPEFGEFLVKNLPVKPRVEINASPIAGVVANPVASAVSEAVANPVASAVTDAVANPVASAVAAHPIASAPQQLDLTSKDLRVIVSNYAAAVQPGSTVENKERHIEKFNYYLNDVLDATNYNDPSAKSYAKAQRFYQTLDPFVQKGEIKIPEMLNNDNRLKNQDSRPFMFFDNILQAIGGSSPADDEAVDYEDRKETRGFHGIRALLSILPGGRTYLQNQSLLAAGFPSNKLPKSNLQNFFGFLGIQPTKSVQATVTATTMDATATQLPYPTPMAQNIYDDLPKSRPVTEQPIVYSSAELVSLEAEIREGKQDPAMPEKLINLSKDMLSIHKELNNIRITNIKSLDKDLERLQVQADYFDKTIKEVVDKVINKNDVKQEVKMQRSKELLRSIYASKEKFKQIHDNALTYFPDPTVRNKFEALYRHLQQLEKTCKPLVTNPPIVSQEKIDNERMKERYQEAEQKRVAKMEEREKEDAKKKEKMGSKKYDTHL